METPSLQDYFIQTHFFDLLPLAQQIATDRGYGEIEMIEAVCRVYDKYHQYPPAHNRTAWFKTVFTEKLGEARSEILARRRINQ
jgi:hypothetical protein